MTHSNQLQRDLSDSHRKRLHRLQWLAELFDNRFCLPGTNYRFGLDGILGLIPVAGDVVTGVVALYLSFEGWRLGLPRRKLLRMAINVGIDILLGSVPLLGDFFDISWKANHKNVKLVLEHLALSPEHTSSTSEQHPDRPNPPPQ